MNTDGNQDLTRGKNTALLLKNETEEILLVLNLKHARLEWERLVL